MRRSWPMVALLLLGCGSSHGLDGPIPDAGPSRDATSRPDSDTRLDGSAPDASAPAGCAPEQAEALVCPEFLCDGPDSWHWNGDSCFAIDCGACTGAGCSRGALSREACERAHASCDPLLCRGTGGTWMWWALECAHYVCGHSGPADCEAGGPVCNCGPGRRFAAGEGCVPADCAILDPPPTPQQRCEGTGGTWSGICCDTVCGEACPLDCVEPACDCGPGREFLGAGCVETARCHERSAGESCDAASRCEPGTICCEHCGGVGCSGPTCEVPACDSDPCTDMCGNRCDVP